jgi:hypothetical protein
MDLFALESELVSCRSSYLGGININWVSIVVGIFGGRPCGADRTGLPLFSIAP